MSQRHLGWSVLAEHYDDGGYTGGNLDRPALQKLLCDLRAGKIDWVVIYKVDRLSRSLLDFARLMEVFEKHGVSLVSATQPLNTTGSLGRLTLNILLSFAQFEREIIADRTRDKMLAARRRGKWVSGVPAVPVSPLLSVPSLEGTLHCRSSAELPQPHFVLDELLSVFMLTFS